MPPTRPVFLAAVTDAPRQAVTWDVAEAVDRCGDILDARRFGGMVLAVRFELRPSRAGALLDRLRAVPIELSQASVAALRELEDASSDDDGAAVIVALNVTFRAEERDLRVPVPAVPG